MANGGWTTAVYLDEGLSDAQLAALRRVFSGELGGPPSALAAATGTSLPERTVSMTYTIDGNDATPRDTRRGRSAGRGLRARRLGR